MRGIHLLNGFLGPLKEDSEVTPNDWIFEGCFNSVVYPKVVIKFINLRVLEYLLKVLEEDGACLAKCDE